MIEASASSTGSDGPNAATITSAKILLGSEINVSIARLSSWSVQPPLTAESSASAVPVVLARTAASSARPIVNRVPCSSRLSTSRPR